MNLDLICLRNNSAGVAQLVELLTCNEEVARSIRVASFGTSNIWAGTQVAKGDRLCKRSVLSKGRMEK